jgi:O-antigen/teichoic acid export membrane protein
MTLTRFLILIITIYPLVSLFGLLGAGYSALASVVIEMPVVLYFIFRTLKGVSKKNKFISKKI